MATLTVLVSGTDTEIGKTWLATRLIESLRASGNDVRARKPVQSFDRADSLTDAEKLAAATGEAPEEVTPEHRWYPLAMAPPMAADALGLPEIRMQELASEIAAPTTDVLFVEGVGGPRSPIAHNGDTVSLARAVDAELVIVVGPSGLGAINSLMLAAAAFSPRPTIVFLNRFNPLDELHVRNRSWLAERHGRVVVTEIEELALAVTRMLAERAPAVG